MSFLLLTTLPVATTPHLMPPKLSAHARESPCCPSLYLGPCHSPLCPLRPRPTGLHCICQALAPAPRKSAYLPCSTHKPTQDQLLPGVQGSAELSLPWPPHLNQHHSHIILLKSHSQGSFISPPFKPSTKLQER